MGYAKNAAAKLAATEAETFGRATYAIVTNRFGCC